MKGIQKQISQFSYPREWQKFRGQKVKILAELEHSGGMTTRAISTRTGLSVHTTKNRLGEMRRFNLVEKVERWGWRITYDGLLLLLLQYDTTTAQQQHNNSTTIAQQDVNGTFTPPTRESDREITPAPGCYFAPTCHIKRLRRDKRYTVENADMCLICVWYKSAEWHAKPGIPVETRGWD